MQCFIDQVCIAYSSLKHLLHINKTGLNGRREYFLGENQVFTVELILDKKTLTIHYVDGLGFPRWFSGKESSCQAGNTGFDPWVDKISWEGNDSMLRYCCLGNLKCGGVWQATVHGVSLSVSLSHTHSVRYDLKTKQQQWG